MALLSLLVVLVDAWADAHLRRGGIGFFADPGSSGTIRWIRVTERDAVFGRVAGLFGF